MSSNKIQDLLIGDNACLQLSLTQWNNNINLLCDIGFDKKQACNIMIIHRNVSRGKFASIEETLDVLNSLSISTQKSINIIANFPQVRMYNRVEYLFIISMLAIRYYI